MLISLFATLNNWFSKKLAYRRTLHELQMLTNRDLADLGICRCDIERIALESARKRNYIAPRAA
jgi:uncharacterized protein YjiS (DUF1127 family)